MLTRIERRRINCFEILISMLFCTLLMYTNQLKSAASVAARCHYSLVTATLILCFIILQVIDSNSLQGLNINIQKTKRRIKLFWLMFIHNLIGFVYFFRMGMSAACVLRQVLSLLCFFLNSAITYKYLQVQNQYIEKIKKKNSVSVMQS